MKRALFLFLTLFLISRIATAMEIPPRLNLFHDEEESGCRTEEVQSRGDDPILRENDCHREICGGNFWGLSAVDVCCNDQEIIEGGMTYNRCWMRRPTRYRAEEAWRDVSFPRRIENPIGCGNHLVSVEEYTGSETTLADFILPDLYADPAEASQSPFPWSGVETLTVSNTAAVIADIIEVALANGDPQEVGEEGSLFRRWVEDTWMASRFVAHVMSPIGFPVCPPQLTGLCDFIGHRVEGNWANLISTWGSTHHLNSFVIEREFANPNLLALVMGISIHETTHILFHWTRGLFEDFTSPAFDYNFISPPDPVLNYEDEMSASMVGIIAFHFLSPGVRGMLPAEMRYVENSYENIFANLLVDGGNNLAERLQESYVYTFFWTSLTPEQQNEILGCVDWMFEHSSGRLSPNDQEASRNMLVFCIGEELGNTDAVALLQQLNNRLLGRGGGNGIGSGGGGDGTLAISPHADLHHDYLESPDVEGGPGGSSEYEAPAEGFDWDYPGNFQGPNDPNNFPNQNYPPESCVEAMANPTFADLIPSECANWCWDHFEGGRDGNGICERITNRDVEEDCRLSTGGRCEAGEATRRGDCETDRSYQTSDFCVDACGSSGSLGYCDDLCLQNHTYRFCDNICRRGDNYGLPFCDEICRDDFSPDFCWSRCRYVSDSPGYCESICNATPRSDMCDRRCERNFAGYCRTRCDESPGLGFCEEWCEERPTESFCTPEEGAGGESEIVGSDVIDCPVGWFTTIGTLYMNDIDLIRWDLGGSVDEVQEEVLRAYLEHYDHCDPYVGRMICCRLARGEEVCLPDGDNDACEEGGYCGCPVLTPNEEVFEGCCMHPDDGVIADHQCLLMGEGCSCLRQAIRGSCW
ncbi:MAG: hypothetical protein HYT77_01435 [Deltaproteobacteria bacterium]|nr:hypothetical protein [Deltaproteobacteria bacterium]